MKKLKKLQLKKWVKFLLGATATISSVLICSLNELNFQSLIIILVLFGIFATSIVFLLIEEEKAWNEVFK